MSSRCRTQRARRDSWADEGRFARRRAAVAAARDAIDGVVLDVIVDYDSGVHEVPADDGTAVGGEAEWAWCEWTWFGEEPEVAW